MNSALWLLLGFQARGWARSLGRVLRTVRGAILGLVGAAVVGVWLWAVTMGPRQGGIDPDALRREGPTWILAYCVVSVLLSRGDRTVYFNPAEVDFLFCGPFTRRQLLIYKLTSSALVGVPATVFFTLLLQSHAPWFVAAYVGLFLGFFFLQLFAMCISLFAVTVGARAYSRGRKAAWLLAGVGVAALLFVGAREAGGGGLAGVFRLAQDHPVWKALTLPLRPYIETFLVEPGRWDMLLAWGGLALAFTGVLIAVVLLLDAQYLEAAAATSERVYSMLRRMRRGDTVTMRWGGTGTARWGLPAFPYLGGVGPIAWRQMTTALRSLGRIALVLLLFAPVMLGPLFSAGRRDDPMELMGFAAGMTIWLSLLLTTLVPFDFRGDLDRMEVLKTLPIPAWRMVLGQLATPVAIMAAIQTACLVGFWLLLDMQGWLVLGGVAVVVPLNFLLFLLDNLLFLWFPSRMYAGGAGDFQGFQALGRNVLILMAKGAVLGAAAAAAAGIGLLAGMLTGYHLESMLAAGGLVLSAFGGALLPLAAQAYRSFDVSRDMPG